MPLIPLDQIHEPETAARRRDTSPEQDELLRASIATLGQLQPILLRPNGNGFLLVAGRRRLRAIVALGHAAIEAEVLNLRPDHVTAAAAAENMARVGMDPLDQWRAIVQLQSDGFGLAHAAACLGLSERAGRRLDKLGRLHPDMLALIERFGMPAEHELGVIASAAADVQARAAIWQAADDTDWWHIASACRTERIPRRLAIFDIDMEQVLFEVDLFAEGDDEDAVYTTDIPGFVAAQKRALAADIEARKAKKQRVALATTDKTGQIKLPKGYVASFGFADKPKTTETVLMAVAEAGYHIGCVVTTVVKKAAGQGAKGKPADAASDAGEDAGGAAPATAHARPLADRVADPPEPAQRDPITAFGRQLLARARTEAIRRHVTGDAATRPPEQLLALLVLALSCWTVQVRADPNGSLYKLVDFDDLAARLVPPHGAAHLFDDLAAIREIAAEALARLLVLNGPDRPPDAPTEWIGQAIGADAALPRFDTPEFLATVAGAELKRIAADSGLNPAKTVAGLRDQLAGAMPDWRPTAAVFGAPGPTRDAA